MYKYVDYLSNEEIEKIVESLKNIQSMIETDIEKQEQYLSCMKSYDVKNRMDVKSEIRRLSDKLQSVKSEIKELLTCVITREVAARCEDI